MKLSDLPKVEALPVREKLRLVDELWISAAPQLSALRVSAEEKAILDERWAVFLKNPESALTVEKFKQRLKGLRG